MALHLGLEASGLSPVLFVSATAIGEAHHFFATHGLRDDAIAFGIGAGSESRRWPADNFRDLARAIIAQDKRSQIILIGGENDAAIASDIAADLEANVVVGAGVLGLSTTAAILRRCSIYVGNDSGPMHLAAAAGCRVVEISKHPIAGDEKSYSSPIRFGPVARISQILRPKPLSLRCTHGCNEDHSHCIANISVPEVQATFNAVRGQPASAHSL